MKFAKNKLVIASFLVVAIALLVVLGKPRWGAPDPPRCSDCNLVMILVDTLRADHLSCYGHERDTSPNICKLADEGIIFKRMFSNTPSTKPSIASLFTSMYPSQHKSIYNEDVLGDALVTLAEILSEQNYETFAINGNPTIKVKFNYDQGFTTWIDNFRKVVRPAGARAGGTNKVISRTLEEARKPGASGPLAGDGKKFLYIHYLDPHSPYTAPKPYKRFYNESYEGEVTGSLPYPVEYFRDRPDELEQLLLFYDNEIRYVDDKIGELLEMLKEHDLFEDSIIILLSDHGEAFMEHGYFEHSNGLYSEVIDVPLIIRIPGYEKRVEVHDYVQTIDLLPTILDVLNIDVPYQFMGNSVFAVMGERNRSIFTEHLRIGRKNPQKAFIVGKHKLIKDLTNGRYQLFDLDEDPLEQVDLIEKAPEADGLIQKMESLIEDYASRYTEIERQETDLDKESYEQLKALGYIH